MHSSFQLKSIIKSLQRLQSYRFGRTINTFYKSNPTVAPELNEKSNDPTRKESGYDDIHTKEKWSKSDVEENLEKHVVYSWGASDVMRKGSLLVDRGEGVYVIDFEGKKYYDWTSQAICTNFGYTVPQRVVDAITKQLQQIPMLYGGLASTEIRARLAKLLKEITPEEITGFIFPTSGSDANEAAIRMARRFTGRHKIINRYRSYHGGATGTLTATGDFRRWFAEAGATGFVKMYDFEPYSFQWGESEDEAINRALAALEEQIILEGPQTVAAIMTESIVGSGGVLVAPERYFQGVRALCDKYNILMIIDEVMAGFGRTGRMWGFQHYKGVVPDIFTMAKAITGSWLPLSAVGLSKKVHDYFKTNSLGWGTTFQAHPVSMACAYETIKYMIESDIVGHVQKVEPVMADCMNQLMDKHPSIRQGRLKGLFGCLEIQNPDGRLVNQVHEAYPPKVIEFKKNLLKEGIHTWVRSPLFHCCPPLIITEDQIKDGMSKIDRAWGVLDKEFK